MLATKFIIALCPATPIYLVKFDVPANRIFSRHAATISTETTRVKTEALVFATFEAAMDVCKDITGWGGAQRVEQIAVQVPDPQSLATEDDWHDVAAAASCAWDECSDCDSVTVRARHTEDYLRSIGLKVGVEVRAGASCPVTLYLADHLGNTLQLDFDPMVDGFDITEATTAADAKPRTAVCDCCARRRPQSMVHTFEDTHDDGTSTSTACEDCIVDAPANPDDGIPCDGCGATDAEPCGEGFALCAACRKHDDPNPPAMTFDSAWLDGILGRDDLTFDQTPLTAEQAKHARIALASALRRLVLDNAPRLASIALTEARDNT